MNHGSWGGVSSLRLGVHLHLLENGSCRVYLFIRSFVIDLFDMYNRNAENPWLPLDGTAMYLVVIFISAARISAFILNCDLFQFFGGSYFLGDVEVHWCCMFFHVCT